MTKAELEEMLEAMRDVTREHTATPEKARAFLRKEGVFDDNDELAETYRRAPEGERRD
ncbi:MAG: hypothetical protein GVY13_17355 [Alphaproteobacteria bacterium]|jgi:hypothetical protein|nr:hypothetical protein [Alphaproteobacteria bacterium]